MRCGGGGASPRLFGKKSLVLLGRVSAVTFGFLKIPRQQMARKLSSAVSRGPLAALLGCCFKRTNFALSEPPYTEGLAIPRLHHHATVTVDFSELSQQRDARSSPDAGSTRARCVCVFLLLCNLSVFRRL